MNDDATMRHHPSRSAQGGLRLHASLLLAACAVATLAAFAPRAQAANYVVLSLIDRQLTVVTATGPNDKGLTVLHPRKDGTFDLAALKAADAAIRKAEPDATIVTLASSDPKIYAMQDKWIDGAAIDVAQLIALLKTQLAKEADPRLVVIAIHRADPRLPNGAPLFKGTRTVAGLGFYVEGGNPGLQRDEKGGEPSLGYIAPFVSMRMVLIDPPAATIEGDVNGAAAMTRSALRSTFAGDPWNAITDKQRVEFLEGLIQQEIDRMTPTLLRQRKR